MRDVPKDLSEEAVAEWVHANGDPFDAPSTWKSLYEVERNRWRFLARAVLALVREKVREAVDATKAATDPYCECDNGGTGGRIHIRFDETNAIVALVMGSPLPPPRCETCFGCGYIPGTYERPTCDVCGGTGKEAPRG